MAEGHGRELNTKATVASGGAGTILLALAERIPDSWPVFKMVAHYSVPAATVAIAAFWVLSAAYFTRWKRRKDMDSLVTRARTMRDCIQRDPYASSEHKANAQRAVENYERLSFDIMQAEVPTVEADLKP